MATTALLPTRDRRAARRRASRWRCRWRRAGSARPVLEGGVALEELEVLGDQEDEPGEREEDDHDRAAGGGEPQVAEQRDVEHRVGDGAAPRPTNTAAAAAANAKPTMVAGPVQPRSGASMMVNTKVPIGERWTGRGRRHRPVAWPGPARSARTRRHRRTSPRPPGPWRQTRCPTRSARAASRRVIGPKATPSPVMAPHSPMARARSPRSVNTLEMIDSVAGKISAAPTPITARTAISAPELCDEPADGGRSPEHRQPGEQGALAAVAVAEAARRQHERREGQRVGVDDPLQLPGRRIELTHQRRQGNVHDRRVEVDRERSEAQHGQCQAPVDWRRRHAPIDSCRHRHGTTMTRAFLDRHP